MSTAARDRYGEPTTYQLLEREDSTLVLEYYRWHTWFFVWRNE